jgi:predicted ester cyclase
MLGIRRREARVSMPQLLTRYSGARRLGGRTITEAQHLFTTAPRARSMAPVELVDDLGGRGAHPGIELQREGRRDSALRARRLPTREADKVHFFHRRSESPAMSASELTNIYRAYIDCLNRQDWPALGTFVDDGVVHNGARIGLAGYRAMLERDFEQIPDLSFAIELLVADERHVAARLAFDCTPKGEFLGLAVNGKKVFFAENVIYAFSGGRIVRVWSVIDKAAIEAQL